MILTDPPAVIAENHKPMATINKTQCQYCSGMYKHINRHIKTCRAVPVATATVSNEAEKLLLLQIELKKLELQTHDLEQERRKEERALEEKRLEEEREKRKIEAALEEKRLQEEREKRDKNRREQREAEENKRREERERRRLFMEEEEKRRRARLEKEEQRYKAKMEKEEREYKAKMEKEEREFQVMMAAKDKEFQARMAAEEQRIREAREKREAETLAEHERLQETIRRNNAEIQEAIRKREAEDRRHAEMLRHDAEQNAIKIHAMMTLHTQETETIRSYHDRMFAHLEAVNNRPRNLSLGSSNIYAPDELRVYGTHGDPWFRADELTAFTGGNVFPRSFSMMGMAREVIYSMAFKGSGDLSPETDFVRVEDWSDFSGEMERVVGVENRDVDRQLDRLCASLPYAEDSGYRPYVPTPSPEPAPQVSAAPFLRRQGEDRATIEEAGMTTEDRVGEYGSSLSSFRLNRHKRAEFIHRLRHLPMSDDDRNALRSGLAVNRARLHLTRKRLENNASYVPDAMDRYLHDQRFQQINGQIDPSKRRFNPGEKRHLFHNVFFPNRNDRWECRSCHGRISPDSYEIGHIVPSKCGNVGSNGVHNVMPLCHGCNHKMGSLDAELWMKQQAITA